MVAKIIMPIQEEGTSLSNAPVVTTGEPTVSIRHSFSLKVPLVQRRSIMEITQVIDIRSSGVVA